MEREINLIQLANAVQWWMSYTSAVGRSYVLAESAIKFPLAEYLERLNLKDLKLEFTHPKLSGRSFDLHFEDKNDQKTAIEFKFIKNGSTRKTDEKKRVFNDLMRLSLYIEGTKTGYFLICGAQNDFSQDFQRLLSKPTGDEDNQYITPQVGTSNSVKIEPDGFYKQWFSFDNNEPIKEIEIQVGNDEYGKIYQSFLEDYNKSYKDNMEEDLVLPVKISTKLLYLSQEIENENDFFQPATIGIWEVVNQ